MKRAVFSFFTLRTSGDYSWWDEFPSVIGNYLKEKDIDHLCFYRAYSENSVHLPYRRYQISHRQIKNPLWVRKIISPLTRRYDKIILHHHTYSLPCGLWVFNNIFNKKSHWIITDHNLWVPIEFSVLKRQVRKLLRSVGFLPEMIIGCSEASKKRLQQIYGKKNVDFIYNGIEIPDISPPKKLSSKPIKALFVGRLEEYKGLWPLVEAFKMIKERKIDAYLTIVGDGPLRGPLHEYVKMNALENYINIVGHSSNVSEFYSKNHFLLITSIYEESFGLVSVEAQSWYLPCIYTDSGGLPETQINYETGIMIPKNNPRRILEAIHFFRVT